uniref:Uncharacterized protein n=1 Tax=Rhizophora mucronata TaxID=61149 RepID=A0A2P2Q019_RHIMU
MKFISFHSISSLVVGMVKTIELK